MKRKIITINEALCNGCGNCVTGCAEGALQIINGKARLVKEQFCDGMGDCIGTCPTGALKIEDREVPDYDEKATRAHVAATGGSDALRRFDEAALRHAGPAPARLQPPTHAYGGGGCPGSRMRFNARPEAGARPVAAAGGGAGPAQAIPSDLQQWPVQLHLVQPGAPFFKGRELAVLSTCSPVASADAHWRFIRGRGVVVACPKLDDLDGYVEKLAAILSEPTIPKVIVVRMAVPCCGGLTRLVAEAVRASGRADLIAEEVTLDLNGDYQGARPLPA